MFFCTLEAIIGLGWQDIEGRFSEPLPQKSWVGMAELVPRSLTWALIVKD